MILTESASPSPRGCVSEGTPLSRALLMDTAPPPGSQSDVAADSVEALSADSSVKSL